MTPATDWTPAFPGQRAPFQQGNTVAEKHGAFSPRRVDPLARTYVDLVRADPAVTWLAPVHGPALWAWARAEAQVQLLTEYLEKAAEETSDGIGDLDADRVRSAYLLLHRAESRATTQRARLGLDPLSRAKLGRDLASAGAADAVADLTRMREQHERATGARVIDGE